MLRPTNLNFVACSRELGYYNNNTQRLLILDTGRYYSIIWIVSILLSSGLPLYASSLHPRLA
jgi:hypothetical protein